MSRIFITGSTDGIGLAGAKLLASQGHKVTLHARNSDRAAQARKSLPDAEDILIGDLSSLSSTRELAAAANNKGTFDAVIHNAGLGPSTPGTRTGDDHAPIFQVNVLAPYVLTCLMNKPKRLLFLSSSMHMSGDDTLHDLDWRERRWEPYNAYCDSKLHDVLLARYFARKYPSTQSSAMDPGWIKTKMGGSGAPGTVDAPAKALAAYAVVDEKHGIVKLDDMSGAYFNPSGVKPAHASAADTALQDRLVQALADMSGVHAE